MTDQYQNASLLELFLLEAQAQTQILDQALIGLSQHPTDKSMLESSMRAAHSLKGAARLVGVEPAVGVAHEMEELLVEAMRGQSQLNTEQIQLLMINVVNSFKPVSHIDGPAQWSYFNR